MLFASWLRNWKASIERRSARNPIRRRRSPARRLATRLGTNTSNNTNTTGSLGWAVTQVDADTTDSAAQPDLIAFNIPTSDPNYNPVTGAFTIQLPSAYYLNNPVVIDGYTQTGANPNTLPGAQLPSPGSPPTAQ